MKKSLIALAVMAAAGAASAQSSVQLYGIVDAWVGSSTTKNGMGVTQYPASQTGVMSGGVDSSRFGFKGSEDLGGGLKAVFTLEQGFNVDNGSSASAGFNREASVGLQGGFGEVRVGKMFNAFDDVNGAAATVFNSALAPINNLTVGGAATNPSNGVKYTAPTVNGFTGSASYAFGEDKTNAMAASKQYALAGQYENGPVKAGLGYLKATGSAFSAFVAGDDASVLRANGSYNLGVAVLKGSFGRLKDNQNQTKTNEYEFGADLPLASNLTLAAGYGAQTDKNAAGMDTGKKTSLGLAVAYTLSKRTFTYAGLNNTRTKDADGELTSKTNILAVGVNHKF